MKEQLQNLIKSKPALEWQIEQSQTYFGTDRAPRYLLSLLAVMSLLVLLLVINFAETDETLTEEERQAILMEADAELAQFVQSLDNINVLEGSPDELRTTYLSDPALGEVVYVPNNPDAQSGIPPRVGSDNRSGELGVLTEWGLLNSPRRNDYSFNYIAQISYKDYSRGNFQGYVILNIAGDLEVTNTSWEALLHPERMELAAVAENPANFADVTTRYLITEENRDLDDIALTFNRHSQTSAIRAPRFVVASDGTVYELVTAAQIGETPFQILENSQGDLFFYSSSDEDSNYYIPVIFRYREAGRDFRGLLDFDQIATTYGEGIDYNRVLSDILSNFAPDLQSMDVLAPDLTRIISNNLMYSLRLRDYPNLGSLTPMQLHDTIMRERIAACTESALELILANGALETGPERTRNLLALADVLLVNAYADGWITTNDLHNIAINPFGILDATAIMGIDMDHPGTAAFIRSLRESQNITEEEAMQLLLELSQNSQGNLTQPQDEDVISVEIEEGVVRFNHENAGRGSESMAKFPTLPVAIVGVILTIIALGFIVKKYRNYRHENDTTAINTTAINTVPKEVLFSLWLVCKYSGKDINQMSVEVLIEQIELLASSSVVSGHTINVHGDNLIYLPAGSKISYAISLADIKHHLARLDLS